MPVRQAAATQATYLTRFRLCVSATRNAAGSPQRHGGAALPACGGLRLGAGTAAGWPMVAAAHGLHGPPKTFPTVRGGAGPKSLDASTPHCASPPAGHGMLHNLTCQGTVAKPPRPVHVVPQVKRSHYKSTLQHACRHRGCNVCAQSMQYSVNESLGLRGYLSS